MDNRLIFLYPFSSVQANFAECLIFNGDTSVDPAKIETRLRALAMEGRGMVTRAYLLNMVSISV
jgi:hypothetical protein